MPDFQALVQLARRLADQPALAQTLADHQGASVEQVLRIAQAPFLSFQPYGAPQPPYTCQMAPARSTARLRACIAGNRSGKSRFGLEEDVHDCLGLDLITKGPSTRFVPPIEVWIVSDTEETSINIAQRTVADEILGTDTTNYAWELVDDSVNYRTTNGFTNNTLAFTNGSRMGFKFSSQGRASFQGTKKHKIHLDEEQPRDIYQECYARTIDFEGQLLITMTPIFEKTRGMSWMYEDLYVVREEKNIAFFNWSIYDNPYISSAAKAALVDQWDEDELDARAHGMFTPLGVRLAFKRNLLLQQRQHVAPHLMQTGHLRHQNGRVAFIPT